MVAALLITLREGLEAALIIGIVLGVLQRLDLSSRQRDVWVVVVIAVAVSIIAGIGLFILGIAFEGRGEKIFEGVAMILAACVLTWMIFWMQGKNQHIQKELEFDVKKAAVANSQGALFGLAFVAVVREGIETALFLTAAAFSTSPINTLIGGGVGLLLSILLGWLLFVVGKRLRVRQFFKITGLLLLLFAAGLLAHGLHEFQEAGIFPVIIEHLYDINPLLDENSSVGVFLKTLFGYNGNPSLLESLVYIGYLAVISVMNNASHRRISSQRS